MAIAEVRKVQIVAHGSVMMGILSSLQEEGLIHLERTSTEGPGVKPSPLEVSELEHRLHRLSSALEVLSHQVEKNIVETFFVQKPCIDRQKRNKVLTSDYLTLLIRIEQLEAEKNELFARLRFLEKERECLVPLKGLELPLSLFSLADSVEVRVGMLPNARLADMRKAAENEALWYEVISHERKRLCLLLIYPKKEKEHFGEFLQELDFAPASFTEPVIKRAGAQGSVKDVIDKIDIEIKEGKAKLDNCAREGQNLCVHREKLMLVHDVCLNEWKKIVSSRLLGATVQTFFLEGWICSSDMRKLKSKLKPYSDVIEIYSRAPRAGEDPPVVLENPRPGKPFELLTRLYGLPRHGSLDPTLSLAPFFFIFVGLCVSEAGYGLLVALMSFLYIKLAKPKDGQLQFLKLLLMLGISNVILGTLFGGWFGFPVRQLIIIDPLEDPLSFLYLSLAHGFTQVWFGTFLNMIEGIKTKQYLQPLFVQGGWLVLLPSLSLYALTGKSIWGIFSLIGAAGIVFFASPSRNPLSRFLGGLYSLYNISGYISDVLSYSRLLALGLGTSVIAMVVNALCMTALSIPWIGWLAAALIFIIGHMFNLVISVMGGFVHSMRLQYVEFFRQFYKSGGRAFRPFSLESRYVEFL
jgi:V/A-type H+-transporting ATPase subunit I